MSKGTAAAAAACRWSAASRPGEAVSGLVMEETNVERRAGGRFAECQSHRRQSKKPLRLCFRKLYAGRTNFGAAANSRPIRISPDGAIEALFRPPRQLLIQQGPFPTCA